MLRWWIAIGVAALLGLVVALVVWRLAFPPLPDEQQAIALYTAHEQEFASLTKVIESHCTGQQLTSETSEIASRIDPKMRVLCDYDGTVRFILGVRGLMTIGPERIIGLTYIPGDPARKGTIVPELASHKEDVGNVYLRQIDNRWYVFVQNTE